MGKRLKVTEDPNNPATFGPAMRACTDKQQRFVISILETGSDNFTRAALEAGYAATPESARRIGSALMRNDNVLDALAEERRKRLTAATPLAVSTLRTIIENQQLPTRDRLRAIEIVLNRSGMGPETNVNVRGAIAHVHRVLSPEEQDAKIANLARFLNLDPQKLLGTVVDAEYEEVTATAEGLEDVL